MNMKMLARAAFALIVGATLVACGPKPAAVDPSKPWTSTVKQLRIGSSGSETDPARIASQKAYQDYLAKELGVPVKIYTSSDYNGVAQAMAAKQIDVAQVGASNYANMWLDLGDAVRPVLTTREVDGALGYYSLMVVRADSPYKSVDDLKGKVMAFADVNSTSGYLLPSSILRSEGKEPSKFFGKTIFAGGHEQAVVAVLQKQADAAVVWSSAVGEFAKGYSRGALTQMVDSGILDMKDLRVIWKGGPIPNGPMVVRSDLPADFIEALIAAHEKLPKEHPDIYNYVSGGQGQGFARVDHEFYKDIVAMRKSEEAARRER